MNRKIVLTLISCILMGCSNEQTTYPYPVIDIINSIGNYQKVYCSDYFDSIELIPLETNDSCLLEIVPLPKILLKDSFIFMKTGINGVYAFDLSGNFRNQIGRRGQGVGEYNMSIPFINKKRPVIYLEDSHQILEYDYKGNFIRSFKMPMIEEEKTFTQYAHVSDNLFIAQMDYDGKSKYKYGLINDQGEVIKYFPGHIFFNRQGRFTGLYDSSLPPFYIDQVLYVKDYVNDTIYSIIDSHIQPAYVFDFGKYSYPKEYLETFDLFMTLPGYCFIPGLFGITGTPDFLFYEIIISELFSRPKSKPGYNPFTNGLLPTDMSVFGLYDIKKQTNILLDTDSYHQKGMVNDLNGGLPFIPRYYAGNGLIADVWNAEDMLEMLTEEYFASQTIKDQQAHQKLKEILKNLKEDDNPVVVIAKVK
ncbi:MAG: 6-bladed beta-propeller [Tannerellaceae bacterium]|nr:6-bladed beta-propeller [Tannerellaceae bacterium]